MRAASGSGNRRPRPGTGRHSTHGPPSAPSPGDTLRRVKKTSIYLEPELDEALARRAAEEGITKAEFIRRTLAAPCTRPEARARPEAIGPSSEPRSAMSVVLDTDFVARRCLDRAPTRATSAAADVLETLDDDLVTTPLALAEIDRAVAGTRRRRAARLCERPRRAAPTPCAGGPTRWTRRSRIARRQPGARARRRLARRARRPAAHRPHRHLRPTLPHPDARRDGEAFVMLPADA